MISPSDRLSLHAATLDFLRGTEGLAYLQELYKSVELPPSQLFPMRDTYLASLQNAQVGVATLWMINSGVTAGGQFSGAALLVCGAEGSEQSESYVQHICDRIMDESWNELPRSTIKTIKRQIAKEDFEWGNCRTLPLDFTENYPVHLFDTIVGRDSIYVPLVAPRKPVVPCLINPAGEAKAFAIPGVVLERCGVELPHPHCDAGLSSFQSEFAKDMIPGLYEEDRLRSVSMMTSQDPGASAGMMNAFWKGLAEKSGITPPPGEFEISAFKEENHLVSVIEFPAPVEEGDVFCAAAVVGPVSTGSAEEIQSANFFYYVLEKTKSGSRILKKAGEGYESMTSDMTPDLSLFVEWVVGTLGGTTRVRRTESGDADLAAAMQKARETVTDLIGPFVAGELEDFTVKVAITDASGQTEHMWLGGVTFEDGHFSGHITEDPHTVQGFVEGQRFRIPPEGISDWMYLREGRMFGNHTLRAMLPSMPEAEASKYLAVLAD